MTAIEVQFAAILAEIRDQKWSPSEWAAHEADDWFHTSHFEGGFEADASYKSGEFNFSHIDERGKEWWFTFKLEEVPALAKSGFSSITLIDPDTFDYSSIEAN